MSGYTVRWLLGADDDGVLDRSVESSGVLATLAGAVGKLSGAGHAALGHEVSAAIGRLLDIDLGGLLVEGWRTATALRTAAEATLADPATSEVVDLARHKLTSTYRPHVDLLVDGRQVTSLPLELTVVFDVHSVVATVRGGRLVGLHCGRCEVTGTLAAAGATLASRTGQVDAGLLVPLGSGIPLVGQERSQLPTGATGG
jgi:hypothetical protein